ncbi:diacylglycerol kinase [Philodulcilactobacillus myokoensis]|uniref:Diacylglycerol kinase n=1 Tax=Philodulcilactobacillus myokoensis TaxID=2929573 RepID=A0A9W6ET46_9LACO|nr:diacylglycerol kinase family protein [Philodulcilactobacillus myokoensis]GLB47003.1 diacylglycerol kinase [Philodulcilactobacillus myokoensis]
MQLKYFIILNKTANGHKVAKQWPQIKQILNHYKINYQVTETKYSHHAKLITNLYLKKIVFDQSKNVKNILFAIGGDGTINDVLSTASNWQNNHPNYNKAPIAFLPLGADNNFAKANHLPLNWKNALNQILKCQKSKLINIGVYNEEIKRENGCFTNNLGIGFDAEIVNQENQFNKKHHHKWQFKKINLLLSLIVILYNSQTFPVDIIEDGKEYHYQKALMLNIANSPYFNGFNLIKHANIKDSKLSLIVVERKNIFSFIFNLMMIAIGHYLKRSKTIHHFKSNHMHITVPSLEYGQTDGEEIGSRFFDLNFKVTQWPFWL